ncbi:MAG: hypothetical protein WBQ18_14100 [Solirubrobacteraceae bacterium]
MTHLCCTACRVRFPAVAALYLTACPECGLPPTPVEDPRGLLGFRLLVIAGEDAPTAGAAAASILDYVPKGSGD